MEESPFSIQVLKKTSTFDKTDVVSMIQSLAKETENKELMADNVSQAVSKLLDTPQLGFYLLVTDNETETHCAMDMMTFEFNICYNKIRFWIQSVYVKEQFRKKGIFKSLLKFAENAIGPENVNSLKLYMETDNEVACKTYLNLGFSVKDIMYEVDFHFDQFEKTESLIEYTCTLADLNDIDEISAFLRSGVHEISSPEGKAETFNFDEGLKRVLSDRDLGKVHVWRQNSEIYYVSFCFFEFSDWRNKLFWYNYKLFVNEKIWKGQETDVKPIIRSLLNAASEEIDCCGLRLIVSEEGEVFLKDSCLHKPHYYIFNKNIN